MVVVWSSIYEKIFVIFVISLLWSSNIYSKSINLSCKIKTIKQTINGKITTDEPTDHEQVLIINFTHRTIKDYGLIPGFPFYVHENITISDSTITWTENSEHIGANTKMF